jgi:hypothetical protein
MNTVQKLDHLAGQVNALSAFVSAVIHSHQNISALVNEYNRTSELQTSSSLPLAVSEEFLQGQNQTRTDISALLAAALAKRS